MNGTGIKGIEDSAALRAKKHEAYISIDKDAVYNRYVRSLARSFRDYPLCSCDEIKQAQRITVFKQGESFLEVNNLRAWHCRCSRNHCLNQKRKPGLQEVSIVEDDLPQTGEERSKVFLWSRVPSPLDQLVAREDQQLWDDRFAEILPRLRATVQASCTDDDLEVIEYWAAGFEVSEIALYTGRKIKTIYRVQKRVQKAIVAEFGLELVGKIALHDGLPPLVAKCLHPQYICRV